MRKAFADTFYWIALANPRDQWHAKALVVCHDEGIDDVLTFDSHFAQEGLRPLFRS
jgi:predicted nucleic acid-binding protein